MTIKDMTEKYSGQYVDIEVYKLKGKKISMGYDFIDHVDDYDENWQVDIVYSGLYGEQEYNEQILGNTSVIFTDMYKPDDKVLVILLEQ